MRATIAAAPAEASSSRETDRKAAEMRTEALAAARARTAAVRLKDKAEDRCAATDRADGSDPNEVRS